MSFSSPHPPVLVSEISSDAVISLRSTLNDCYGSYGSTCDLVYFKTAAELHSLLNQGDYELCFISPKVGSIAGTALIAELRRSHPNLPCILFGATEDHEKEPSGGDSEKMQHLPKSERNARLLEGTIRFALRKTEETRRLEEEKGKFESANKAKSDFLSVISHDLRTPLHPILGLTDMVREEVSQPEMVELLDIIQDCGQGLLRLVQDLLDFTSVDLENVEFVEKPFSFQAVLEQCLDPVTMEFRERGLDLDVNYLPDSYSDLRNSAYLGDAHRIQQVISNILSNALKFTNDGSVTVSLLSKEYDKDRELVRIEIKDTGIGISAEYHEQIFEPLYQVDTTGPRHDRGTGLGLSICRRLVSKMNGTISVDSEPGKGSTFIVEIPLMKAPEPAKRESKHDFGIEGKVLVVEDTAANMTYICRLLSRSGIDVVQASNGAEAIRKFEADPEGIQLILMDLYMPVCGGLEATRKIRAGSEAGSTVPIIAVTAIADPATKEETMKAGMNHYITKPFKPSALYEMLGTVAPLTELN
jgi:signal transduction histidine kinase/CheY-like chemotaxis protein